MAISRCSWVTNDPLYIDYHDKEWGRPVHNDQKLFEMLTLEGAQAGLSWITILKRRESYREAFDNFDVVTISRYTDEKIEKLLQNTGIIRNRKKIESVIRNANAFLEIQDAYGSFDSYIWRFVGGEPIINHWDSTDKVPAITKESEAMSKDLKKKNFSFVGPTICYAFMQATGMVNDHAKDCFLYNESGI